MLIFKAPTPTGAFLRRLSSLLWWVFRLVPSFLLPSSLLAEQLVYHRLQPLSPALDFNKWTHLLYPLLVAWWAWLDERAGWVLYLRQPTSVLIKFLRQQDENDFILRQRGEIAYDGIQQVFAIIKETPSPAVTVELRRWVQFEFATKNEKQEAASILARNDPNAKEFFSTLIYLNPSLSLEIGIYSWLLSLSPNEGVEAIQEALFVNSEAWKKLLSTGPDLLRLNTPGALRALDTLQEGSLALQPDPRLEPGMKPSIVPLLDILEKNFTPTDHPKAARWAFRRLATASADEKKKLIEFLLHLALSVPFPDQPEEAAALHAEKSELYSLYERSRTDQDCLINKNRLVHLPKIPYGTARMSPTHQRNRIAQFTALSDDASSTRNGLISAAKAPRC